MVFKSSSFNMDRKAVLILFYCEKDEFDDRFT